MRLPTQRMLNTVFEFFSKQAPVAERMGAAAESAPSLSSHFQGSELYRGISRLLKESRVTALDTPYAFSIQDGGARELARVHFHPPAGVGQLPRLKGVEMSQPGLELDARMINAILHLQAKSPEAAGWSAAMKDMHLALRHELQQDFEAPLERLGRMADLVEGGKSLRPGALSEHAAFASAHLESPNDQALADGMALWKQQLGRRRQPAWVAEQWGQENLGRLARSGRVIAGVPVGTPVPPGAKLFTLMDGKKPFAALALVQGPGGPEVSVRDLVSGGSLPDGGKVLKLLGHFQGRESALKALGPSEREALQEATETLRRQILALARDPGALLGKAKGMLEQGDRLSLESADRLEGASRRLIDRATIDPVTGLGRRSSFDRDFARWVLEGREFSLVVGDLDDFSAINNHFGHETGDRVLRQVCDVMRRYGLGYRQGMGEELMLMLPKQSVEEASTRMRAMLAEINALTLTDKAGRPLCWPEDALSRKGVVIARQGEPVRLGMSMGVVEYQPGMKLEELLKAADTGIYQAKSAGKNAVSPVRPAAPPVLGEIGPLPGRYYVSPEERLGDIVQAAREGRGLQAPNMQGGVDYALSLLEHDAKIDRLTALKTRRTFDDELAVILEQGKPFALGYADIDNFSKYNNTFGHAFGDEVLQAVAGTIGGERGYRLSGEELGLILEDGLDLGQHLEGIRRAVSELRFYTPEGELKRWPKTVIDERTGRIVGQEGEPVTLTLSIGAARHRPGMDAHQILDAADQQMNQVKRTTKNGVSILGG